MSNPNCPTGPVPPAHLIIPPSIRFDGIQFGVLYQFTDLRKGPSEGATFNLPIAGANNVSLAKKTAEVRESFRQQTPAARPQPPLFQRQPVLFRALTQNHY